MKTHLSRGFALVMAAVLFAAGTAGAAQTKITMLVTITGNGVAGAEDAARVYMERNPDVVIDVESRPGGAEGDNLVKTRLSTGTMTDIFMYNSGALLQALNPAQTLTPLNDLECMPLIDATYKPTVSAGGNIYGVPFGTTRVGGMLYNKKAHEKLGLAIPKTWAEFIANCQKAKDAGVIPVIQTYRTTWSAQILMLADYYNLSRIAPDFAAEFTQNRAKFATTPAALKGFERLQDVYDRGFLNPDAGAATYNDGLYMLGTGEGLYYPLLSHAMTAMLQDIPEYVPDIGFFAQPSDDPAVNGVTAFYPNALYVPKTTKNLPEVKKFLEFIGSVEGAELFMTGQGAQGPSLIKGAHMPDATPQAILEMIPYFESGRSSPAMEFIAPIKGPALEQICIEVGTGMRSAAAAAALYDEDCRKQAQQLRLPGW